jgi:hypothetical protein
MKLEKGIEMINNTAGRPATKADEAVKIFMVAEDGDSFFIPLEDRSDRKLNHTQSYYVSIFNRYKNRVGKSTFKLKSRRVDGGVRFWFFDENR